MENFIKKIDYEIKKDSNKEYHSKTEFISASGIKRLKQSPLHFIDYKPEETEAMFFGSAYHTFILEPDQFKSEYFVFDETHIIDVLKGEGSQKPRGTNKYKEWYGEQMDLASGKIMIELPMFKLLEKMKARLLKHKYVKSLLSDGEAEMSVYCELELFTGQKVKVKIRPDYMKRKKHIISDLKTCVSASVNDFPRHAADYDYHIQAALYHDIMSAIEGKELGLYFFFIAQEKSNPFAFNIFESSPQFIGQGRYEYEQLILLYLNCKENDRWPGYQVFTENKFGVNELSLPSYMVREISWYEHKF